MRIVLRLEMQELATPKSFSWVNVMPYKIAVKYWDIFKTSHNLKIVASKPLPHMYSWWYAAVSILEFPCPQYTYVHTYFAQYSFQKWISYKFLVTSKIQTQTTNLPARLSFFFFWLWNVIIYGNRFLRKKTLRIIYHVGINK